MARRRKEEHKEEVKSEPQLKRLKPITKGQEEYLDLIRSNTLTLAGGPAGSGKTYIGCSYAIEAFRSGQYAKLLFTRPALECGEKIGFLPGDQSDKITPYLRPVLDVLYEYFPPDVVQRFCKADIIELCPLGLMRGRTLKNCVIVGDEMQNATYVQLKMLVTRLGEGSKMILSGDESQTDLPHNLLHKGNPFTRLVNKLHDVKDVGVTRLTDTDIVRHPLVRRIAPLLEEDNTH